MSTVLGIDIGTQNVKAVLYDIDTQQCSAVASAPLALHQTKTGIAEQEAQWWIDGLHAAVNQLEPNLRGRVVAIGVSGQQHGFVPINRQGQPLAPVKLWCDTSTTAECDCLYWRRRGLSERTWQPYSARLYGFEIAMVSQHSRSHAQMDCTFTPRLHQLLFDRH